MSVLFALGAALGWGSSDFAAGHASRRSSAVSVVILTHLASVIALLCVAFLPGQGGVPTVPDIGWGLAAGLGGGFGAMLLFRGLAKGSMATVAPITAAGAALIPVAAGLVSGESIGLIGIVGVALALAAIIMVSLAAEDDADADGAVADDSDERAGFADAAMSVAPTAAPASVPPAPIPNAQAAPAAAGGRAAPHPVSATMATLPNSARWNTPWAPPTGVAYGHDVPAAVAARISAAPMPQFNYESVIDQPAGTVALLEAPPVPPVDAMPSALAPASQPLVAPSALDAGWPAPGDAAPLPPAPPAQPVPAIQFVDDAPTAAPSLVERVRAVLARPGIVDALLSGVGFGLFFVFIARTAADAGHWPLVSARAISVIMFVTIAMLSRGAVLPEKGSRKVVALAGLLDAVAALFFVLSTRSGLLSVGAVLASLYPAATILLARLIAKEKITPKQAAGLVLAGLAVSLLAI